MKSVGSGSEETAADEALRRTDDFAHTFNNIICVINNHANLVMDGLDPHDPKYESMVEIRLAVRRAMQLVSRFLASGQPLPAGGALAGMPGSETVLVVEDDEKMRHAVAAMLTRHGYTVLTATSPEDACRIAAEYAGELHLLLTDALMPMMNGDELRVKIIAGRPGLRTVFISSQAAGGGVRRAVRADGVTLLARPFTAEVLLWKIRAVLDSRKDAPL